VMSSSWVIQIKIVAVNLNSKVLNIVNLNSKVLNIILILGSILL